MDEGQDEVTKDLVKLKTFETKEEAINWRNKYEKQTGKMLSDIGHINGVWYTGYSRAGEIAAIAVKLAGEFYNLNVPLSSGYVIGKDWSQCH